MTRSSSSRESIRLQSVYHRWAPVYDRLLGRIFSDARRRSIEGLALRSGEWVVLPGAGTGLDLPLLLAGLGAVVALDFTPEMLARARAADGPNAANLVLGDAMRQPFADGTFDAAILHLILAVAPDGRAVLADTCRLLRSGGRIAVFDKFASERGASPVRRALNRVVRLAGTEIDRTFSSMLEGLPLEITGEASVLRGAYRIIWLRRTS
jgi:ubiquinone/menaquinone biosynthesis C-methylase UbiE